MLNPRFPHTCTIYRLQGVTSFKPQGDKVVVYEGVCRKSTSQSIRSFDTGVQATGKVDAADYRISVPGIVKGIQKGDLVDVADLIGEEKGLRVIIVGATQLLGGATEMLCSTTSN